MKHETSGACGSLVIVLAIAISSTGEEHTDGSRTKTDYFGEFKTSGFFTGNLPKESISPGNHLRERFSRYIRSWKKETLFSSSIKDKIAHPEYQNIIKMGKQAVPFLLEELDKDPNHAIFIALRRTANEDPTSPEMGFWEAVMAWKEWAKENSLDSDG